MLGISPDATLVDISHDLPAARHPVRGRRSWRRRYKYFPAGHHLPRRRRSRRRHVAPRPGRRGGRVEVRRARQRRADRRVRTRRRPRRSSSSPSGATRGRRSAGRSKAAIALRRPRRGWRRAIQLSALGRAGRPTSACSICHGRARPDGVAARARRPHRSVRQRRHEPRSAIGRDGWRTGCAACSSTVGGRIDRPARLDLRGDRARARSARSSAAPITSSAPPRTPPARRSALGAGVGGAASRRAPSSKPV